MYDSFVHDFQKQKEDLTAELESHQKADDTFLMSASYLLELAQRAVELFERSQPAQKCQLLKLVLANCKAEGEKLIFNLKAPFEALRCAKETQNWLPLVDKFRTVNWSALRELLSQQVLQFGL